MRTAPLHVRRLAMAAAVLGAFFSPSAASAQSQLDVTEAQVFLGNWDLALEADFGPFDLYLQIEDQGGKVSASVGSPEAGMQDVTDITRSDESLILNYEMDYQGQLFPVVLALEPDGEALSASFETGGGELSAGGTATKAAG